ncbi:AAA family ATPase, partial [Thermodesulfobacteriota bacterium]
MLKLKGFDFTETLFKTRKTVVLRGVRKKDNAPVIAKLLRETYPSIGELERFENGYRIAKDLDLPGVVKPYVMKTVGHGKVVVMEDFNALSLKDYIRSQPIDLKAFLRIAVSVADILGDVHRHGIIHNDIKPGNVLLNPKTLTIKISDFSLASRFQEQIQADLRHDDPQGTLAYISPEQTGRMNRPVDFRSDFYSLGVTFYEMLTGRLPFEFKDPMEMVHAHMDRQPIPPEVNTDIPKAVSDINMKLLSKMPEDRYQSASGLKADFERCDRILAEKGEIESFEIGQHDISDRFVITDRLYGRDLEVTMFHRAFEKAANGRARIMAISGPSGIGKTFLVNHAVKTIKKRKFYFISGKCDYIKRDVPYSVVIEAFGDLIRQTLAESEENLDRIRTKLLTALGTYAQLVIDVIPDLELIIGKQHPVPVLGPSESLNRFKLTFQNFISVFTTIEHPLILFLDNLQWADDGSISLVRSMIDDPARRYFLYVPVYRDHKIDPSHPAAKALYRSRQKKRDDRAGITLEPLNITDITCMVSDTLFCSLDAAEPLAVIIKQKTDGNPFFAVQFLQALHRSKILFFNHDSLTWQWDLAQVREMQSSDNVADLLVRRLEALPESSLNLIQLAACIGSEFDLATLSQIAETPEDDVARILAPALIDGLILSKENVYQTAGSFFNFSHERIQVGAYTLLGKEKQKQIHLQLGRILLRNTPEEKFDDELFANVEQLNSGKALIKSENDRFEAAELNLLASRKAKGSTAYVAAAGYARIGIELLPKNCWESHYKLTFDLYRESADADHFTGDFDKGELHYHELLARAASDSDKILIYQDQARQFANQRRYSEIIDLTMKGLDLLGFTIPESKAEQILLMKQEGERLKNNLAGRTISDLYDIPEMTEPNALAMITFIVSIGANTFFVLGERHFSELLVRKVMNLILTHGRCRFSALVFCRHACSLVIAGRYQEAHEFGRLAINLDRRDKNFFIRSQIYYLYASLVQHWTEHIKLGDQYCDECFECGKASGNFETVANILSSRMMNALIGGSNLNDAYQNGVERGRFFDKIGYSDLNIV